MKKIYLILFIVSYAFGAFGQNYNWKNVNLQGMGFVTGIIAHPTAKDVMFARTDVGGLYRWNATAKLWEPVTDGKVSGYSVESIALDPINPDIVYAAIDRKLYKSSDRGTNWNPLPNFPAVKMNGNGQFRFSGKRLVVDPNNSGSVLFLVTRENGLQISPDKGVTWKSVSSAKLPFGNQTSSGYYEQTFVAVDKTTGNETTNSSLIYVGVQGKGVYKSDDGGENWILITGGPDVSFKPVCGVVGSDGSLYVSYSSMKDEWNDGPGKIYKYSSAKGMTDITPTNNNGGGFIGVDVDLNNPNKITTVQWSYGNSNGIHYSEDGGVSWKQKAFTSIVQPKWYPGWVAWGYTGHIMFDPFTPKRVWLTNGFGIYVTDDITVSSPKWRTEMQGVEEFVVGQVHCPPTYTGSDVYLLQMDQIAFQVDDKDIVPSSILFPNDFGIGTGLDYCAADPNVIAIVGSDQNNGALVTKHKFTTDGGLSWNPFNSIPLNANNGNIAISATNSQNWVWVPRHQDGPKTLPFYTVDQGKTWVQSTGIPNVDNGATHIWTQSSYLQSDKVDGKRFYYYMVQDNNSSGVIYRSDDGGASFQKVYSGLPSYYICKMKAHPTKTGNLFFYKTNGDLYRTSDGAKAFTKVPLIANVKGVGFGKAISPSTEISIYLAAKVNGVDGVYRSTDDGKTWTRIDESKVPLPIISDITGDLRYGNIVYLGTGGRGVIYGLDASISKPVSGITLSKSELSLGINETIQLKAVVSPENASYPRYSWKSLNSAIATVTNGQIIGKKEGKTNIIVTTKDGTFTDTCEVNVMKSTGLNNPAEIPFKIYPNPLKLKNGSSLTINNCNFHHPILSLIDLNGKIIDKKQLTTAIESQFQYDLPSSILPGIYVVSIGNSHEFSRSKIIIQ